jgi:S1-C subfamily serine protease
MSQDAGVCISRLDEGGWAESAALGNRDIVVGMAGRTIGRTNDNFDSLVGNAPVETVALRDGGQMALTINPCGGEWSG